MVVALKELSRRISDEGDREGSGARPGAGHSEVGGLPGVPSTDLRYVVV